MRNLEVSISYQGIRYTLQNVPDFCFVFKKEREKKGTLKKEFKKKNDGKEVDNKVIGHFPKRCVQGRAEAGCFL